MAKSKIKWIFRIGDPKDPMPYSRETIIGAKWYDENAQYGTGVNVGKYPTTKTIWAALCEVLRIYKASKIK